LLKQQEEFITKALFEFTFWFWKKSFKENLHFLCFRHFKSVPGGDNRSTSFCESGNSALKRDPMGTQPNQPIDTCRIATSEHEQRRIDSHESNAMQSLVRKAFVSNDSSEIDTRKTFLYDQVVDKVVDGLIMQFRLSLHCIYFEIGRGKYLVQERFHSATGCVTKYVDTAMVEIQQYDTTHYIVLCSCHHYIRKNFTCRHIYCVVNELPAPAHCGVKEQKLFEAFYMKNTSTACIKFTEECDKVLLRKLRGPLFPLPIRTIVDHDVTSTYPREQFIHPRCVPINPVDSEEGIIVNQEKYDEKAAEMNEHGFNDIIDNYGNNNDNDNDNEESGNFELGNDNIDDDVSKSMNPQAAVKNGYTTAYPKFKECTGLVTDNGSLSILNTALDRGREELYQYQNNNKKKHKHKSTGNGIKNSLVSLPAVDTSKQYKRLKPANSPSRKK